MLDFLYILAVLAYFYSFILFVRFFVWRRLAHSRYWSKKTEITLDMLRQQARLQGSSLPFFTVMVPARNESLVIEKTIDNLMLLDYPKEYLQIVVITDHKERLEHEETRPKVVSELLHLLLGGAKPKNPQTESFYLAYVITRLPLGELLYRVSSFDSGDRIRTASQFQKLLFAIAAGILEQKPLDLSNIYYGFRRTFPGIPDERFKPAVTEFLLLLRLALSKVDHLLDKPYAPKRVEIIAEMAGKLPPLKSEVSRSAQLDKTLRDSVPSAQDLGKLFNSFFLTTQEVVENCIEKYSDTGIKLTHCEVPYDFDGQYGGVCTGQSVRSTKGRALNYAFGMVNPQSDMLVFYDAESHPDHDVLLHAARHLLKPNPPQILQGPLFQVRNYYRMGALSRIGGLYKAIAHDWYLPLMFYRLPFVGGTNLFIAWKLIQKMKGFDETSLTEDLEFGCRAHLYFGVNLTFLTVKSTEQTPPTIPQYFKQRLRWGSGHLQVIRRIRSYPYLKEAVGDRRDFSRRARSLWWNLLLLGPIEWIAYQLSTVIVLVMDAILVANLFGAGIPGPFFAENPVLYWSLVGLNGPYLAFTFYCYRRYDQVFDRSFAPINAILGALDILKLVMATFVVFLLPAPYTWSVVLTMLGKAPVAWVKTPRTSE
jgi:cellulose synthase/poly-beta-1,6-N-acetylglucosamine synthase-like glycosyltransferase